ncbi:MAG TPA: SOS response-associated peptidase [Kiritimatiellia bacterium]|nr:SOS response-associated peptidase [Kiritimatiellia bacterium]
MCGRLVLTSSIKEKIKALFDDVRIETELTTRYNITPGQPLLAIMSDDLRNVGVMNWGFPSTTEKNRPHINARGETVHRLATFKHAFSAQRCLVFADGFYEWKRDPGQPEPQPWYFYPADGSMLMIAGLWTSDEKARGSTINRNGLVITTEANQLMHPIHNRMPVIFTSESAKMWLQPETSPETLKAMLQPCSSGLLRAHPVSRRVNRRSAEGPDLIQPVQILEQTSLF